jgi:hypothetical protein
MSAVIRITSAMVIGRREGGSWRASATNVRMILPQRSTAFFTAASDAVCALLRSSSASLRCGEALLGVMPPRS